MRNHFRALSAAIGLAGLVLAVAGIFTFTLSFCIVGGIGIAIGLTGTLCLLDENAEIQKEAQRRIRREDMKNAAKNYEQAVEAEMARIKASRNK